MNEKLKLLFVVLLIVIIGGLVYIYRDNIFTPKFSSENVRVKDLDVSQVPEGFPSDIPLEQGGIVEHTTLNYPDRKVVLYSVGYKTPTQLEEVFAKYQKYLTTSGYTITKTNKTIGLLTLEATKGVDSISVNITPANDGANLVKIAVLHRN